MKVRRLYELLYGYSMSLDDEILFYDSGGDEVEVADIDGDDGYIIVTLEQKSSETEVEK